MCVCVILVFWMCSLFGSKMLNREVLAISECLRTPADQTPLTQLLYTGIFCGCAWDFRVPVSQPALVGLCPLLYGCV